MLSADEIVSIQEDHRLLPTTGFKSVEDYCLYLVHERAYLDAADLAGGLDVADVGCNVGYGTRILASKARSVVGFDVNPQAVAEARAASREPNLQFEVTDGRSLPLADDSVDVVVSFQVIEHVADYGSYLGEMKRVLRPGGTALFTTPNAAIRLDPGMQPWNLYHVREFRADELKRLLGEHFGEVRVRGLFAEPSLYEVERRRNERSLRNARRPLRLAAVNLVKRKLPGATALRVIRWWKGISSPPADLSRYSVDDLYFQDEDLDRSLDLMAICRV